MQKKYFRDLAGIVGIIALLLSGGCVTRKAQKEGGVDITRGGKALAEIVIEKDKPLSTNYFTLVKYAAEELQTYVRKMSGVELPIVEVEPGAKAEMRHGQNYIFVGESVYTRKLGIRTDDLKGDGFRIIARDNWLALVGRDYKGPPLHNLWYWGGPYDYTFDAKIGYDIYGEAGSLYAVYDFLGQLGVRWYMPGEIGEVVPQTGEITAAAQELRKEPDYEYRQWGAAFYAAKDKEAMHWYRRIGYGSAYPMSINHSWRLFIKRHAKEHPEWCAVTTNGVRLTEGSNKGALCLSAPGIFDQYVKDIREYFDKNPGQKVYPLMPMDEMKFDQKWCQCESCRSQYEMDKGYCYGGGAHSKYVWGFINRVAAEVARTYPGALIGCCAYEDYTVPPEGIKFCGNVAVMIAPICQRRAWPWQHDAFYKAMEAWQKTGITNFYIWEYYNHYGRKHWGEDTKKHPTSGIPVIFARMISKDLRKLKGVSRGEFIESETSGYFGKDGWALKEGNGKEECGCYAYDIGKTHWNLYVEGKLLWDSGLDVDILLTDYCDKFYGPASEDMKMFYRRAEEVWCGNTNKAMDYTQMYPQKTVDELLGYLEDGMKKCGDDIYARRVKLMYDECKEMRAIGK